MIKDVFYALKRVTGKDFSHLESDVRTAMSAHSGAHIEDLLDLFGDGELRDNSECSREFRLYLKKAHSVDLAKHAKRLVSKEMAFREYALMDVVNEVARRLGFEVGNGYYKEGKDRILYGGLWRGDSFDVMMRLVSSGGLMDIESVVSSCESCVERGFLGEKSHVVLVASFDDTDALADQIRGSRHGWRMRIVGVEALVRMMVLYSLHDDVVVRSLVRSILLPEDYVRVDRLVDFVGAMGGLKAKDKEEKAVVHKEKVVSTKKKVDVSSVSRLQAGSGVTVKKRRVQQVKAAKAVPVVEEKGKRSKRSDVEKRASREKRQGLRDRMVDYVEKKLGCELQDSYKSLFTDEDRGVGVRMLMSNRYDPKKGKDYFYNISKSKHVDALSGLREAYMVFSFGDRDDMLMVPLSDCEDFLKDVLYNEKLDSYLLDLKEEKGRFSVKFPKRSGRDLLDLTGYRVKF